MAHHQSPVDLSKMTEDEKTAYFAHKIRDKKRNRANRAKERSNPIDLDDLYEKALITLSRDIDTLLDTATTGQLSGPERTSLCQVLKTIKELGQSEIEELRNTPTEELQQESDSVDQKRS